jgi:hypothetical protein
MQGKQCPDKKKDTQEIYLSSKNKSNVDRGCSRIPNALYIFVFCCPNKRALPSNISKRVGALIAQGVVEVKTRC